MFVGHEFLAFALAGSLTAAFGADSETAVAAGLVAGLAALLPDLDVVYGLVSYLAAVLGGAPLSWEGFWATANGLHRVVTHPLPVVACASVVVAGAAVLGRGRRGDLSAVPALLGGATGAVAAAGLVWVTGEAYGSIEAFVALGYVAAAAAVGLGLGLGIGAASGVSLRVVAGSSAVGLVTHPFGDLFMAAPPPLLAPVGPAVVTERVVLAADPTLNLLAVLFVEVSVVWAGVVVFARLTDRRLRDALARRSALGLGYAAAVVTLPRPTMTAAHVLGFTVVPLAVVVGITAVERSSRPSPTVVLRGSTTGLATLTVAATAYLAAYLLVG
jgi:hypothetical protein